MPSRKLLRSPNVLRRLHHLYSAAAAAATVTQMHRGRCEEDTHMWISMKCTYGCLIASGLFDFVGDDRQLRRRQRQQRQSIMTWQHHKHHREAQGSCISLFRFFHPGDDPYASSVQQQNDWRNWNDARYRQKVIIGRRECAFGYKINFDKICQHTLTGAHATRINFWNLTNWQR